MHTTLAHRLITPLFILAVLTGCSVHEPVKEPDFPITQDKFENSPSTDTYQKAGKWWTRFQSSQLDKLMEQAFEKNRSLKISQARIEQKLAALGSSSASIFPGLSAGTSVGKSQSVTTRQDGTTSAVQSNSFSLSLNATYELDLFGKNAAAISAAELDVLAAIEDYKGQLSSIAYNVCKNWLNALEYLTQIKLLQQTIIADKENLKLVTDQFRLGTTPLSDVLQAQQQVLLTQFQVPVLKGRMNKVEHSLSLLVGDYPKSLIHDVPASLFLDLPPVHAGLPSGLIQRRPDLRAALSRIKIADHDVAAAVAARFPRISLTASTGTRSDSLDGLSNPDNLVWNLIGNLTLPIFDAGRRKAEVKRKEAMLKERIITYHSILYQAFREVEENLVQIELQREQHKLLEQRQQLSAQSLQLTKQDYINGLLDWSRVMSAQTQFYNIQKSLISSKKTLSDLTISLLVALGGEWMEQYVKAVSNDIN